MQYIIKNNLQQRKEIVVFISQTRVWEMVWVGVDDGVGGVIAWVMCVFWVAHYFSNSFLKPAKKKNSALFFRVSLGYLNNVITKLFPKQIQNSGIFRTRAIRRNQNLGILRAWGISKIPWISRIQFTQSSLYPCHLGTKGIFRTLSNIYNRAFCSEPWVILLHSKPEEYLEFRQAYMMQHFFKNLV